MIISQKVVDHNKFRVSISEMASGLKWATELVVDGALEAVNAELCPLDRGGLVEEERLKPKFGS
jgi:hypothetical protein